MNVTFNFWIDILFFVFSGVFYIILTWFFNSQLVFINNNNSNSDIKGKIFSRQFTITKRKLITFSKIINLFLLLILNLVALIFIINGLGGLTYSLYYVLNNIALVNMLVFIMYFYFFLGGITISFISITKYRKRVK